MDFSYLDKKEYEGIPLLDEASMAPRTRKDRFFIRKYTAKYTERVNDCLHRHKYIQINYVYKGSGYHYLHQNKVDIVKGDIFIIPPYVPHVICPRPDDEIEIFEFEFSSDFVLPVADGAESYFDFAYLEPFMLVEEEVKPRFNLDERLRRETENILWEVKEEYEGQRPGYDLVARALLLKLLVTVGRAFSKDIKGTETELILQRYKDVAKTASRYIEEHYDEELTLERITQCINYSKSYFCYLFKAVTGKTYVEYLNEVRVRHAEEMLFSTTVSVAEISFAVGYKTVANFNKYFKQITGVTPTAYRNTRGGKR